MASQGCSTVIQLTSTVVLARLLSPEDYGIMAMVTVVTGFAGLFGNLGLSTAAIRNKDLNRAQQSNLFWMNVAMGLLLAVIVAAASPLVAWFYQKPDVLWVTVALSASFVIGSLGAQHGAMLIRQLHFGHLAVANISGALFGLAVSITLAFMGWHYWALVWGTLLGSACTTVLLTILSPLRPGLPSKGSGVREMLKFGAHVTAFDFVNYFHRNLDNLLIGRFWGSAALGSYSRAYSLLMFPINNLRGPINSVAFPAMSRLQNEPDAFRSYYRQITSLLAFLSMPLTAFMFIASSSIIELALGKEWLGVAPIFAILATVGFIQPSVTNWGVVLLSLGKSKRYLRIGFWNALISVAGFVGGLPWGPLGVAIGYSLITYGSLWPILHYSFKNTPVGMTDFIQSIATPGIASCMTVATMFLTSGIYDAQATLLKLISQAAIFVVLYGIYFWMLPGGKNIMLSQVRLVRAMIKPNNSGVISQNG